MGINKQPALILYFVAGFLFLLSAIINSENLSIIARPIVSSSMFFFYLQEKKGDINYWHLTVILALFVSGIFNLFDDSAALVYVLSFNMIAYLILLGLILKKLFEIKFKLLDKINLMYLILMSLFLLCILYVCIFLVFDSTFNLYQLIVAYGFLLFLVGVSNTALFVFNQDRENVCLMSAIFCFILCDSFYAIYYYYYDFIFFRFISILSNIFSFYFLVHYFIYSSNKGKINLN